jgi:hypothetical protein
MNIHDSLVNIHDRWVNIHDPVWIFTTAQWISTNFVWIFTTTQWIFMVDCWISTTVFSIYVWFAGWQLKLRTNQLWLEVVLHLMSVVLRQSIWPRDIKCRLTIIPCGNSGTISWSSIHTICHIARLESSHYSSVKTKWILLLAVHHLTSNYSSHAPCNTCTLYVLVSPSQTFQLLCPVSKYDYW